MELLVTKGLTEIFTDRLFNSNRQLLATNVRLCFGVVV